ncbi:hypothetical protein [Streptomyces sp. NPDC102283]|uniref:hypothetical protein n=1 Tax=Streptomyces sp. NPDC102283 TaxID=3366155 RepID=UPI00380DC860
MTTTREGNMPEHYSSIGEAVGAAMQHNIRLAQRSEALGSDSPLQARYLPSASADPYSVRGMIARLHEDATPEEVAGIIEEINGALVGALPELSELVAAAADWTRGRLEFPADPEVYSTWETWKALAAAHEMLHDVHEELAVAADGVAACPAQRADLRHHEKVRTLRSRELLDDVFGAGSVAPDLVARTTEGNLDPEVRRQAVALQVSPVAAKAGVETSAPAPATPPPPTARPAGHQR